MKRRQQIFTLIAISILLTATYGSHVYAQAPDRLQGLWMNEQGSRKAEFYPDQNIYFGKLIWQADQTKAKVGDIVFRDLVWNGRLFMGKAVTPRGIASCTISFESEDKIKITGSKGGMSKSVIWTRVK
ncbi:MAG: hypothetical protein O9262_04035 [Cyclobacteriaceae bacterium]|nr:hypothetical protein [Cyclobacteriaceae bacterium]